MTRSEILDLRLKAGDEIIIYLRHKTEPVKAQFLEVTETDLLWKLPGQTYQKDLQEVLRVEKNIPK